jgi:hypothetical protein
MSKNHARSAGRRPRHSHRGARRNHGGNRSNRPDPAVPARHEEPLSLWQRICAFVKRGNVSKSASRELNESGNGRDGSGRRHRKREVVEVTSPKLYVGNLSFDATENDLYDLFRGVGSVQNAEVVCHRHSQRSKGFAFVIMGSTEEALRAVDVLHNKDFMGRRLVVSGSRSNDLVHSR